MNAKGNARPVAGTTERAIETAALAGASVSVSNSTIEKNKMQGKIASLLSRGEQNAVTSADLLRLAGLHSPRALRSQIEKERAAGALILSTVRGHGGYFLPSADPTQGREEIEAFIRTVSTRAVNSQKTLKAARRALRECVGQVEVGL